MRNIQSDTDMRESISGSKDTKSTEAPQGMDD